MQPPSHDPTAQPIVEAALVQPPADSSVRSPEPAPEITLAGSRLLGRLSQSRLAVLAVLFLVTGFLGLPLLWKNRRFSTIERWFWAITNTIYTGLLIALAIGIVLWSYRRITATL